MSKKDPIDANVEKMIAESKKQFLDRTISKKKVNGNSGSSNILFIGGLALLIVFGLIFSGFFSNPVTNLQTPLDSSTPNIPTLSKTYTLEIAIFREASCSCCHLYMQYLETNGVKVQDNVVPNRNDLFKQMGIGRNYQSCHTVKVNGYFSEGHIPLPSLEKFLNSTSDLSGITLPGMPAGSPGMSGQKNSVWEIFGFKNGQITGVVDKI